MLLFLSFQNNRFSVKKAWGRQSRTGQDEHPSSSQQLLVAPIHANATWTPTATTTWHCKKIVSSVGLHSKTPISEKHAVTFREFMFKFLHHHGLYPWAAHHIADNGWPASTSHGYTTIMKRWVHSKFVGVWASQIQMEPRDQRCHWGIHYLEAIMPNIRFQCSFANLFENPAQLSRCPHHGPMNTKLSSRYLQKSRHRGKTPEINQNASVWKLMFRQHQ